MAGAFSAVGAPLFSSGMGQSSWCSMAGRYARATAVDHTNSAARSSRAASLALGVLRMRLIIFAREYWTQQLTCSTPDSPAFRHKT